MNTSKRCFPINVYLFKFKMFKNPFREPTHEEYAKDTLAKAKMELLKALEHMEYYESIVVFKRKQIARLEGAENAKTPKGYSSGISTNISGSDSQ